MEADDASKLDVLTRTATMSIVETFSESAVIPPGIMALADQDVLREITAEFHQLPATATDEERNRFYAEAKQRLTPSVEASLKQNVDFSGIYIA